MPKRTDIKSILIIGAGPIIIGQACEFDYSGVQACKALREEGYRVILINPNPATIMTDPEVADAIYIEPINLDIIEQIIIKEKPDALLSTMGGQVALNAAMELEEAGILKKYHVELIGAKPSNIKKAEDRAEFCKAMLANGIDVPKSFIIKSLVEAKQYIKELKFPVVIRPSFTLGGKGGSIIRNISDLEKKVAHALESSPINQALLEEYLEGWKEFEFEMMRDKADNCIVVCSIENINPMGVHTGDSITVAPALTLTDKEFQNLRNIAISVMREIGIDTGGANVQFAVNPKDGGVVVIEVNPRVSRSSALASKATGLPIAKISAKLAVGLTLDEIPNEITKTTYASFEPTIDYIVTKIPRFAFDKFPHADPHLTVSMKSIGEVMAIGRTFIESMQKALVSLEIGLDGFDEIRPSPTKETIIQKLKNPTLDQVLYVAEAFREGMILEEVHSHCHYDVWFLEQIQKLIHVEQLLKKESLPNNPYQLRYIKSLGFSNSRLAQLTSLSEENVSQKLIQYNITPSYKRIDTCAAEFPSSTPYLYSTHETHFSSIENCDAEISNREKVIIIGSGPNRIGQGIEFDYCCVQASLALKDLGYETIMINCNPETVSTDYTISDRLYFEPLQREYVFNIIRKEQSCGTVKGVIIQFGGQTPLNLISALREANIPILGTSPAAINLAENRQKFSQFLSTINLKQPLNQAANSEADIVAFCDTMPYPLILRPSYVIGGHKMEVVHSDDELQRLLESDYLSVLDTGPVLIEQYLENAKEVDVDAICDGENIYIAGIMEQFEKAGIHSGDSTCALPTFSLSQEIIKILKEQTKILCETLGIKGLINIQFAIQKEEIYIIEVNPRASRTIPFASKAKGVPFAKLAAQVMVGQKIEDVSIPDDQDLEYIYVKMPIFSFSQLHGTHPILNSQMKSTGEVMGSGLNLTEATAKAYLSIIKRAPIIKKVFVSVRENEELEITSVIIELIKLGFHITLSQPNKGILNNLEPLGKSLQILADNNILNVNVAEFSIIINTMLYNHADIVYSTYRKTIVENHIIECTTFHHAKGVVRAIQSLSNKEKLNILSTKPRLYQSAVELVSL